MVKTQNISELKETVEKKFGTPSPLLSVVEEILVNAEKDQEIEIPKDFAEALKDGKFLMPILWKFFELELKKLPNQSPRVEQVVAPIVKGMQLLAEGKIWADYPENKGYGSHWYANQAYQTAVNCNRDHDEPPSAYYAAQAASSAANVKSAMHFTNFARYKENAVYYACKVVEYATKCHAWAAYTTAPFGDATSAASEARRATRRRQAKTMLRLIKEA